jgi:hypothetical protein
MRGTFNDVLRYPADREPGHLGNNEQKSLNQKRPERSEPVDFGVRDAVGRGGEVHPGVDGEPLAERLLLAFHR